MAKISAILITKNEENNIASCLESIRWVDEIIVVDNHSTDKTVQICHEYEAKVIDADWPGFGPQKNYALSMAQHEWILSIDADERVTPRLRIEISAAINNPTTATAYRIPRANYFYNRELKHALNEQENQPIRLFKKNSTRFSDDIVHERILAPQNVSQLANCLQHYPFTNLEILLKKANIYSTLGATKLIINSQKKPTIFKVFWHAAWAFLRIYVLKRGFLDGWPGFLIAFANFEGTFYRYAKWLEHQQNPPEPR